jgi:hypothetical protein
MLINALGHCHLTYCSNIHPGESWPSLRNTLENSIPAVRDELGWSGPFGVGLRVAAEAARALTQPDNLAELKSILAAENLYVFTLNGFPYGPFHGTRVKEDVYLPDWRSQERIDYTCMLVDLMADLAAGGTFGAGSISTVPGAYKSRVTEPSHVDEMVRNLTTCVAHAVAVERRTGQHVTLALEPEPCCFLETIEESVAFFKDHLFGAEARRQLADACDVSPQQAEALMRAHLGLCLDLCHAAVEFESAEGCVAQLKQAEVPIYKVQVSAGLRLPNVGEATRDVLAPFNDDVYLHQVVARTPNGDVSRFVDLPEAFESLSSSPAGTEWRVHFHVPIFLNEMGAFSSTQSFIEEMLALHRREPLSTHLEVETYTWNVLPPALRAMPIEQAIARELSWTTERASRA